MTVTLASVNLFSGRSLDDGRVDGDRLARGVADLGADVVALQEVDVAQPRSGGDDQAALVAHALAGPPSGPGHDVVHRFVPLVAGTPGEPGWSRADATGPPPPGPSYGIALVSRRPVAAWHVLPLEPARGRWPIVLPGGPPAGRPRVLWIRDEPRAAVAAVLEEPRLVVAGTHLSFVPGVNVRQLRQVRRWLQEIADRAGAPLVLLGDLNLPGRLPSRLTRWTPLVSGPTFPSPAPRVQVDHILAHGLPAPLSAAAIATSRVALLPFSDHRAVLTTLP